MVLTYNLSHLIGYINKTQFQSHPAQSKHTLTSHIAAILILSRNTILCCSEPSIWVEPTEVSATPRHQCTHMHHDPS